MYERGEQSAIRLLRGKFCAMAWRPAKLQSGRIATEFRRDLFDTRPPRAIFGACGGRDLWREARMLFRHKYFR